MFYRRTFGVIEVDAANCALIAETTLTAASSPVRSPTGAQERG
jgi:hypothetical protein